MSRETSDKAGELEPQILSRTSVCSELVRSRTAGVDASRAEQSCPICVHQSERLSQAAHRGKRCSWPMGLRQDAKRLAGPSEGDTFRLPGHLLMGRVVGGTGTVSNTSGGSPQAAALVASRGNLPAPVSSFIGRQRCCSGHTCHRPGVRELSTTHC